MITLRSLIAIIHEFPRFILSPSRVSDRHLLMLNRAPRLIERCLLPRQLRVRWPDSPFQDQLRESLFCCRPFTSSRSIVSSTRSEPPLLSVIVDLWSLYLLLCF